MKKHFQQGLYFIYFFGGMSFFSTNSHGADTSSLKGFYLGYTLGYSIAPISFDQTAIQIAVDGGVDSLVGEIGRGYSKNKNLEFFFGYNHIFRKMYFGGEIFLDLVHTGQKKILNDINNQILLSIKRNSFGFGLLGKIGYLFYQDIGVYVALSLKSTSFTLKSIDLFPARGGIASQSQRNHKMRLHIGAEALSFGILVVAFLMLTHQRIESWHSPLLIIFLEQMLTKIHLFEQNGMSIFLD